MWGIRAIRRVCAASALLFLCGVDRPDARGQDAVEADVLLVGGLMYDGTGSEGRVGDVAWKDGRIVGVGTFPVASAGRRIDCQGLWIAPGFIDLHNHSDRPIVQAETRANVNYLTQGCTTVVTGNCGSGPVDVGAYFAELDRQGAGTNVIHLLPHGSLRSEVMGQVNRRPTPEESAKMRELAERAMQDGAYGMSTGLIYIPGSFADTEELIDIATVIGRQGGIYATHMRSEASGLLDSVEETLRIGRESGAAVHISHFKASGKDAWGTLRIAASLVEQGRERGQRVTADQYPYAASSTSLEATLLPTWAREGGRRELARRLQDETQRARIRADIEATLPTKGKIQIASFRDAPSYIGQSLDEIAAAEGRAVADLVLDIESRGGAGIVHFGMQDEEVRFAMQLPWVATASDGSAKIPSGDQPHPRSFGTFARKIGYFAEREKIVSVAAAIRSSSGLPADILGLADRGYLRVGQAADVVVLDPTTFVDHATYEQPFRYSTGACYVFVNGSPAIFDRTATGALAGRALRRAPPPAK